MNIKSIRYLTVACAFALLLLGLMFHVVLAGTSPEQVEQPAIVVPPLSAPESGLASPLLQAGGMATATLRAASGVTITFWTENGDLNLGAVQSNIPHLVLYYQDGKLTPAISRTLAVCRRGTCNGSFTDKTSPVFVCDAT